MGSDRQNAMLAEGDDASKLKTLLSSEVPPALADSKAMERNAPTLFIFNGSLAHDPIAVQKGCRLLPPARPGGRRSLRRVFGGKLLVIWDGLPAHRSRIVQEYVRSRRGRLTLESLPGYAPELNPVEYVWGYWKHRELPNLCPKSYRAERRTVFDGAVEVDFVVPSSLETQHRKRKRMCSSRCRHADVSASRARSDPQPRPTGPPPMTRRRSGLMR